MKSSAKSHAASEEEAGELIANINRLVAEAEEMLNESTSHHAEEKVELINPGYYEQLRREQSGYRGMKARVLGTLRSTDAMIRANPYESLLVTLGIGLLAGAICFPRRVEGKRGH